MKEDIFISNEHGDIRESTAIAGRFGGVVVSKLGISTALLFNLGRHDFAVLTADSQLGGKPVYEWQTKKYKTAPLRKMKWCVPYWKSGRAAIEVRRALNNSQFMQNDLSKAFFTLWLFGKKIELTDHELLNIKQLAFKFGYNVRLYGHRVKITRRQQKSVRIKGIKMLGIETDTLRLLSYADDCQFQGIKF